MADNTPTTLDIGKIVASSLSSAESTGGTSTKVAGNNAPDLDKLTEISQNFTGAIAAQSAVQKNLEAGNQNIADLRQANVEMELAAQKKAEPALLEGARLQASADLKTQQENVAFKTSAGLDSLAPDSILRKSIEEINVAHDRAGALLNAAEIRQSASFGDVLSGKTSFGTFFHDKVIDPASSYLSKADTELAIAKNESSRISTLQNLYTGQAQVNASSKELLSTSAADDAMTLQLANIVKTSGALRERSLAIGAKAIEARLQESQHREVAAHNQATLDVSIENSKRQWESFSNKTTDPAVLAGYIRVALNTIGRADANTYTAERVKEMLKVGTPAAKQFIQQFSASGSGIVGQSVMNPGEPLPPIFGTPGEVQEMLTEYRGKMPPGSEQFQTKLSELSIGMDKSADGTVVKPAQQVANINGRVATWIEQEVKTNTDNSPYGKPHLPTLVAMASMNTPEMSDFTQQILKPLASSGEIVEGKVLLAAAFQSKLPQNKVIAGLVAYKKAAAALVDSTRHPQLFGLPSAASLPYVVKAPTGSLFGTHQDVDLGDEKSLADYFLRKTLFKKAQTNSITLIDAAAATAAISMGAR